MYRKNSDSDGYQQFLTIKILHFLITYLKLSDYLY